MIKQLAELRIDRNECGCVVDAIIKALENRGFTVIEAEGGLTKVEYIIAAEKHTYADGKEI